MKAKAGRLFEEALQQANIELTPDIEIKMKVKKERKGLRLVVHPAVMTDLINDISHLRAGALRPPGSAFLCPLGHLYLFAGTLAAVRIAESNYLFVNPASTLFGDLHSRNRTWSIRTGTFPFRF